MAAYSKAAKRRAKKQRNDNPAGLPEIAAIKVNRQERKNGRFTRTEEDPCKTLIDARCRQTGKDPASKADRREVKSPLYGCEAGKAILRAVRGHKARSEYWDAAQLIRRVYAQFWASRGIPQPNAKCLSILTPTDPLTATAESPPVDTRTDEEKAQQAGAARAALDGWLRNAARADSEHCKSVVLYEVESRDDGAVIRALDCVIEGNKGRG